MRPFWVLVGLWLAGLVAGFALVFGLGRPLPTPAEELQAAMHPKPPVSREAALESVEAIVRLQYPSFAGIDPVVDRMAGDGVDSWLITVRDVRGDVAQGLTMSIGIETGIVEVEAYP